MMRRIGIFLGVLLAMYLLEAFILMKFNPVMWEESHRAFLALGGTLVGLATVGADSDIKKRE